MASEKNNPNWPIIGGDRVLNGGSAGGDRGGIVELTVIIFKEIRRLEKRIEALEKTEELGIYPSTEEKK